MIFPCAFIFSSISEDSHVVCSSISLSLDLSNIIISLVCVCVSECCVCIEVSSKSFLSLIFILESFVLHKRNAIPNQKREKRDVYTNREAAAETSTKIIKKVYFLLIVLVFLPLFRLFSYISFRFSPFLLLWNINCHLSPLACF